MPKREGFYENIPDQAHAGQTVDVLMVSYGTVRLVGCGHEAIDVDIEDLERFIANVKERRLIHTVGDLRRALAQYDDAEQVWVWDGYNASSTTNHVLINKDETGITIEGR